MKEVSTEDQIKRTSIVNGMQAVILFCEMLKNNFGMSSRWLIVNWETDGMFYTGNSTTIPAWNPRPDFYYTYYLQKFVGDHIISSSVAGQGSGDILAYATRFADGYTGIIVVNRGSIEKIIKVDPRSFGVGDRYYIYTLKGVDNSTWPQAVVVNTSNPTGSAWGPLDGLENIPAQAFPIDTVIKFSSPALSVEYILVEPGTKILAVKDVEQTGVIDRFELQQNYPNPFNPQTLISYSLQRTSSVTLRVYDVIGRVVATLVNNERKPAGDYEVSFDGTNQPSGIYFYRLQVENQVFTKKMTLLK
jgi:hypothetical protein